MQTQVYLQILTEKGARFFRGDITNVRLHIRDRQDGDEIHTEDDAVGRHHFRTYLQPSSWGSTEIDYSLGFR
jgi:hypothetical protein